MRADEFLIDSEKYLNNNVFLIYGEQEYLIDKSVNALIKIFNADDMSMTRYEGSYKAGDVINQVLSMPFFSDYSLAVCEQFPDASESERLLEFIEDMPEHARIIFAIKGNIDKRKSFVKNLLKIALEITAQADKDIASWLVNSAKEQGVGLSRADAEYMLTIAGEDMYALSGEINKLCLLGKYKLARKDIEENVSKSADYNIFMLNTLMLNGEFEQAFALADKILKEEKTAIPLVALLSNRFYQMYIARCCIDAGMNAAKAGEEMQKTAKINKYAAKYIIADAYKLSANKIKDNIRLLAEYDRALKTGEADKGIEYILTKLYT